MQLQSAWQQSSHEAARHVPPQPRQSAPPSCSTSGPAHTGQATPDSAPGRASESAPKAGTRFSAAQAMVPSVTGAFPRCTKRADRARGGARGGRKVKTCCAHRMGVPPPRRPHKTPQGPPFAYTKPGWGPPPPTPLDPARRLHEPPGCPRMRPSVGGSLRGQGSSKCDPGAAGGGRLGCTGPFALASPDSVPPTPAQERSGPAPSST